MVAFLSLIFHYSRLPSSAVVLSFTILSEENRGQTGGLLVYLFSAAKWNKSRGDAEDLTQELVRDGDFSAREPSFHHDGRPFL